MSDLMVVRVADHARLVARGCGFFFDGGFAWADAGYSTATGAGGRLHVLYGDVEGDGPWRVDGAEIAIVGHGDPEAAEANRYASAFPTNESPRRARALLRAEFGVPL